MYNRITFNYDGIITKGILLAQCDFIESVTDVIEKKKFWIFKSYKKIKENRKFKMYIVFIPWKHAIKSITFIDERQIISIDYCEDVEFINIVVSSQNLQKNHHTILNVLLKISMVISLYMTIMNLLLI